MIVSQALNTIFDIYCDEKYDENFRKLNLIWVLENGI